MSTNVKAPDLKLVTVAGPTSIHLELTSPGPVTIGRRSSSTLMLANTDAVSREHAVLVYEALRDSGQWMLMDMGSRHGTRLNGIRLKAHERYPVQAGDTIQIQPWTLRLISAELELEGQTMASMVDDHRHPASMISNIEGDPSGDRALDRLTLLLHFAQHIHDARDERALADALLEAAVTGTGYPHALLLRPASPEGDVEVLGTRGLDTTTKNALPISRSLINEASKGIPARLTSVPMVGSTSVLELGITDALCVPIMAGTAVVGFLYLDARRSDASEKRRVRADATDFAIGLGRLAAMAMANLQQLDLQMRWSRVQAEIEAAAESQRFVLPPRRGACGSWMYAAENRPGRVVSGDFFDVIDLGEDRMAVTLGDVAGKGIAASVLMTTAQGFLHAALRDTGNPACAVAALNQFIVPRCEGGRFLSLWLGIFDGRRGTLNYVDAGHGHVFHFSDGAAAERLSKGGGPLIGIDLEARYEAVDVEVRPTDRVLLVSDGFIEQSSADDHATQFGAPGVIRAVDGIESPGDVVKGVFAALLAHAGGRPLADDATAVVVHRGAAG